MDRVTFLVLVVIGILLGTGATIFLLSEPVTVGSATYQYGNGETVFNVTKVNDIETVIPISIGAEEVPYILTFRSDPLSLEDIPVEGTLHTRIFNDEKIYVTIHPEANLTSKTTVAALEIEKIIDNDYLYGVPVFSAMTLPNDDGYPVVSCGDGTDTMTVIFLTLGSETIVFTDGYCIVIVGTDEDELIRATDRFLLTLLGIMQA